MKHSSILWSWYLAIVLVTGVGMVWISMASFRWVHDRQVSQNEVRAALIEAQKARVELERQQRIGEGLWYADSILGPILFNESEQPYQNYAAFWIRKAIIRSIVFLHYRRIIDFPRIRSSALCSFNHRHSLYSTFNTMRLANGEAPKCHRLPLAKCCKGSE